MPTPSAVDIDRLLAATRTAEHRHFWFRGLRRFVTPLIEAAVKGTDAPRILDCGCGTGYNLELLGRYGRAAGFDIARSGLDALPRGAAHVVQASVAAIPFASDCFDLATSFDVLYMLPEPVEREALREMHRVLTPGGALIVNVAAMPALHGHHSVLSGELRRYTRRTLGERLKAAGFDVERMTHTNAVLFPMMLIARALQRMTGVRAAESDITVPAAPVNAALSAALAVEALIGRRMSLPFGSSLLALARKRN